MPNPERIQFDPPRLVQVRDFWERWIDAVLQHAWQWDKLRQGWRAIITVEVDAREIRPWRAEGVPRIGPMVTTT